MHRHHLQWWITTSHHLFLSKTKLGTQNFSKIWLQHYLYKYKKCRFVGRRDAHPTTTIFFKWREKPTSLHKITKNPSFNGQRLAFPEILRKCSPSPRLGSPNKGSCPDFSETLWLGSLSSCQRSPKECTCVKILCSTVIMPETYKNWIENR